MAILHITKDNFEQEVLKSDVPVLVDFWATWCGPCRALGPVLEEIASETSSVKIVKVNVDEQPELASQFRIMSIPTMILFKSGEVADKTVGLLPKDEVLNFIKKGSVINFV